MKTAILSFYTTDFQPLADLALPNTQAYCDRWGFDHIVRAVNPKDLTYYYAIDRIGYLLTLLRQYDLVWVLNTHAFIMNHTIDVRKFVDETHDFFITRDVGGLNAGSYLVKGNEGGEKFMKHVYAVSPGEGHPWKEQKVIQDLERDPVWGAQMKVLDHPSINSYRYDYYNWPDTTPGHFKPGDFVLHLPGKSVKHSGDLLGTRIQIWHERKGEIIK